MRPDRVSEWVGRFVCYGGALMLLAVAALGLAKGARPGDVSGLLAAGLALGASDWILGFASVDRVDNNSVELHRGLGQVRLEQPTAYGLSLLGRPPWTTLLIGRVNGAMRWYTITWIDEGAWRALADQEVQR